MPPDATPTLLLVDSDAYAARAKEAIFGDSGFRVVLAGDADTGLAVAHLNRPDAILAAAEVPPRGAVGLCQRLTATPELAGCPVLVYARRYDPLQAAAALDAGAADYTHHAILPRELLARVRRMLRQAPPRPAARGPAGEIVIDADACEVICHGHRVTATATEFKILQYLAAAPGEVFSRRRIAALLGIEAFAASDRTVDAHVKNIRKKLGVHADVLQTVRGFGYRVRRTPAA
jgi:DNA-binding response OmpR family regulator